MPSVRRQAASIEPVHLVADSTGLKVFGAGEWLESKHQTKAKRKSWRKLHLGLDLISGPVIKFITDGAYDRAPGRDLLDARFGVNLEIIIRLSRLQHSARSQRAPRRFET